MTLRELRYVVALAEYGHFGRAAEACHISQPTLSSQLKKVEDGLGVVLFERSSKTLHITPIGRKIVDQARRVLAEADAIVVLARETARAPLAGPLALGVIPTLSPYLLPWLVPALKSQFPSLRLILNEDLTDRLIERLRSHRIDAAVVALPVTGDDFESRPLFDEPFWFACPQDHPLARASTIDNANLRAQPLLLLTDGHCLRDQALAVCNQREWSIDEPSTDFRATSLETLRQLVAAGIGCTLLPALAVGQGDEQIFSVRPLTSPASRRIGLLWRRSYPKRPELELLAAQIQANLPPSVRAV